VPAEWNDYFVAAVTGSSALAGLLFVAASINLSRVLEFPQLPLLLAQTLIALLSVVAIGTAGLTPDLSATAMGLTIAALAAVVWVMQTVLLVRMIRLRDQHFQPVFRVLLNQLPAIPFIAAGVLLASGHSRGLLWLLPGTLLAFASGVAGAWILLVEIQR
jgi:hypothetical protein